ncbi:MAG: hypothetical protein WCH04_06830 [Gammaproteobacteria bacterium]
MSFLLIPGGVQQAGRSMAGKVPQALLSSPVQAPSRNRSVISWPEKFMEDLRTSFSGIAGMRTVKWCLYDCNSRISMVRSDWRVCAR